MYWTRYFYWLMRWTCAVPLALITLLFWCGFVVFDKLFDTSDGYAQQLDSDGLKEVMSYLFTKKTKR